MNLDDLDPHFLKFIDEKTHQRIDSIAEADGIIFLCPKCFAANNGEVNTHSVICWHPRVPQNGSLQPGRWELPSPSTLPRVRVLRRQ